MAKIISQDLLVTGILLTFDNGSSDMLPYPVDEQGREYACLCPEEYEVR